jgi:hypothetical protein
MEMINLNSEINVSKHCNSYVEQEIRKKIDEIEVSFCLSFPWIFQSGVLFASELRLSHLICVHFTGTGSSKR